MSIHCHYTRLAAAVIAAISSFNALAQEDSDKMIVSASGYSQSYAMPLQVLRLSQKNNSRTNRYAT